MGKDTNYAVLACQEFPLCHGELVPAMDFEHGFSFWRQLGMDVHGSLLSFDALVAIHWVHRMFAFVVITCLLYTAFQLAKVPAFSKQAKQIGVIVLLQFLSGISMIFFNWPLLIAVLHNAGAALLVLLLTMLNYRLGHTK